MKIIVIFQQAFKLFVNSETEIRVELLHRDENRVVSTIHFRLSMQKNSLYNLPVLKKLTINFHEWEIILLISRVRSTSDINKINAYKWKLIVIFQQAGKLFVNSETDVRSELLNRVKSRMELTNNFLLYMCKISISNSLTVKKLVINFHE